MAKTLIQSAAMLLAQSAPTNTLVLWGKTDSEGRLLELLRYDSVEEEWVAITNPGTTLHSGTTLPAPESAIEGDQFLNTATLDIYERGATDWEELGTLATTAPISGLLEAEENLDELANKATSRTNLNVPSVAEAEALLDQKRPKPNVIWNEWPTNATISGTYSIEDDFSAGNVVVLKGGRNGHLDLPLTTWTNANVPIGTRIEIIRINCGFSTTVTATGVTLLTPLGKSATCQNPNSVMHLQKIGSSTFFLTGNDLDVT